MSALVMLSLFVGAVTMSMTESMADMKKEDEEKQKAKMRAKQLKKLAETKRRDSLRSVSKNVAPIDLMYNTRMCKKQLPCMQLPYFAAGRQSHSIHSSSGSG